MPIPHPSPDPEHLQQAEDAQYYRRVLHEVIDMAADIARVVHRQATAEAGAGEDTVLASKPIPDATVAFERIAGTIRRTIALARRVAEPLPERKAGHDASRQRIAARQQVIRAVEDTIEEKVRSPERSESLHAELLERLDGPDLDDSIVDRPIGEIIAEIQHDLGLHAIPGMRLWKRRTPADIAVLCARAAGESVPTTPASAVRERPLSEWAGSVRLAALAEADDAMLGDADPADP